MTELREPKSSLVKTMLEILAINEIGSDSSLAYCFSDADGIETGKSGYSFGRVQFDIENNWTALDCLRACGFRPKDLDRLFEQREPIPDLNIKLAEASDIVDRFDLAHTRDSINHCMRLLAIDDMEVSGIETIIHIVDYHNQLYMSKGGPLHRELRMLASRPMVIVPSHIEDFKLKHTKWGRENPDDVRRRFQNIEAFCKTNEILNVGVLG